MSVRKTIKIITLAGVAAIMPDMASAATPAFGSWSSSAAGVITGCPAGFTCSVINSGDGFLQANVTDGTDAFVQTIITDSASSCTPATCPFSDENFVKTSGTAGSNGIAAKQSSTDAALGFSSSVEINTGWALTGQSVDINQTLSDIGTGTASDGDEFDTTFDLAINLHPTTGVQTGKSMNIGQDVKLGVGTTDSQVFDVRERSGDLSVAAGSNNVGGGVATTWAGGNDVMMTWISQNVDIGGAGSSLFAFQSLENITTAPGVPETVFSTTANDPTAAPFEWDTDEISTFGAAP